MIRKCSKKDIPQIHHIINEAAGAYRGVIPDDCYHTPYMPEKELLVEFSEMVFYGFEEKGRLVGVMGLQPVRDVTLIRHAYVLHAFQRRGVGRKLLEHLKKKTKTLRLLAGTWAKAWWATEFYEKNGFRLAENKDELLKKYWHIPGKTNQKLRSIKPKLKLGEMVY